MIRAYFLIILILIVSQTCNAFDSERQGFVLGGGLGFAPAASVKISGLSDSKESGSSFAVSLMLGYGFNENTQFLLLAEGLKTNALAFDKEVESAWQGFSGFGVRFYFDEIGSSFFVTSGIGLQLYLNSEDAEYAHDSGLGYLIGGGYEFSEHFHFQASLSNGETRDSFVWKHSQVIMTISFIIY